MRYQPYTARKDKLVRKFFEIAAGQRRAGADAPVFSRAKKGRRRPSHENAPQGAGACGLPPRGPALAGPRGTVLREKREEKEEVVGLVLSFLTMLGYHTHGKSDGRNGNIS